MTYARTGALVFLPLLTATAVVLTGSIYPLRAAAKAAPTARLAGVMVNPEVGPDGEYGPNLAFQGTMNQCALVFVVEDPSKGIIGVDGKASQIETFADDTGQALRDEDGFFGPFGMGERILEDGARIVLELQGDAAPAKNARLVLAKGKIALRQAHAKVTHTTESIELTKGKSAAAGPFAFDVKGSEPASWGDGYDIQLGVKGDLESIVSWTAVLASGERVELDRVSTMTFMGKSEVTVRAPKAIERAALELVAWKDAKTVLVPFDVKVRVGAE